MNFLFKLLLLLLLSSSLFFFFIWDLFMCMCRQQASLRFSKILTTYEGQRYHGEIVNWHFFHGVMIKSKSFKCWFTWHFKDGTTGNHTRGSWKWGRNKSQFPTKIPYSNLFSPIFQSHSIAVFSLWIVILLPSDPNLTFPAKNGQIPA